MSHNTSSSDSFLSIFNHCFDYRASNSVFTTYTVISFLLMVPLSIIILRVAHQQKRRKPSTSTSHSDLLTFHMVVMEIIFLLASAIYCVGVYTKNKVVMMVASYIFYSSSCGQMSFHTFTCVERYLAVVYPITYMRVSKGSGVRVRNILILCVWLLFFAKMFLLASKTVDVIIIVHTVQQVISLAVIIFCSLAVLRVLKRSVPGEGGGDRERVHQSKQKAFNTIMAIMGTLLFSFGTCVFYIALFTSPYVSGGTQCVILESSNWLRLPSSVVLPLLFLHRAGKLTCSRNAAE